MKTNNIKTPIYVYNQEKTNENITKFDILKRCNIDVYYAVKSNNHLPLVKSFINANYGFDVASIEELEYVLSLGANPSRISFSAPTKLAKDIKKASQLGVRMYAFDSEAEVVKIMRNAKKPLLIARITAYNEDAAFNLSVKFGMDPSYSKKIIRKAQLHKWPLAGVTFHVGSQNNSIVSWRKALTGAQIFINESLKHGIKLSILNIGGSIPARYSKEVKDSTYYIEKICQQVRVFRQKNKYIKEVIIEPGRALSANTTDLITKVVNIKEYKKPPLIVVDTSVFNGIIEPLEHFEYGIRALKNGKTREKLKYYKVAGISCDGYDIIKKRCLLPRDLEIGDYLLIENTGAYTFVYENFHMREFPKIVNSNKKYA